MMDLLLQEIDKNDNEKSNNSNDLKKQYEDFLKDFKAYTESLKKEKEEDQDGELDLIDPLKYDVVPL